MNQPNTNTALTVTAHEKQQSLTTAFSNSDSFELAQRMAKALASSTMVPQAYQGQNNIGNCLVALELSQRLKDSPFVIMQNMTPIHGKPSWAATYVIAKLNSCGKFSPLRFRMNKEKTACHAECKETETGETLTGTQVTMEMANAEGWTKNAKWKTMREQMLKYRAATFFAREFCPELMIGMRTTDEVEDVEFSTMKRAGADALNESLGATQKETKPEPVAIPIQVVTTPEPAPSTEPADVATPVDTYVKSAGQKPKEPAPANDPLFDAP